jgi:hypothetical protein
MKKPPVRKNCTTEARGAVDRSGTRNMGIME